MSPSCYVKSTLVTCCELYSLHHPVKATTPHPKQRKSFCARQHAKRAYAIAIPSVRLSVSPSDTRVDQSKTVEVRIMEFSLYSRSIRLVFAG